MEKLSLLKMVCINFVFCAATVIASPAQTFTTLAVFNPPVTGWQPHYMSLIQGTDGNFYGTTFYGGNEAYCSEYQNGCGTVFKITSAGTLNALHSFCTQTSCPDCPDGSFPIGGLVQGADGDFYGTTSSGGTSSNCSGGCGTVFKITSTGTLTTLYNFDLTDGSNPEGPLVLAADGNFYGTTRAGGNLTCNATYGCGTVFKFTPSGTLTVLHSFNGSDGEFPQGGLVQATDGNFYGTTYSGGASTNCTYGCGTVFKITSAGTLNALHSFCTQTSCSDGKYPNGELVQASDGNLYGTAYEGGASNYGTVFKFTSSGTSGTLTVLHSFDLTDGSYPQGALVQATDGNLYGTTSQGGNVAPTAGTIFEITEGGKFSSLYSFDETTVPHPAGGLVQATNGSFYGTTASTVFNLSVGLPRFVKTEPTSGKVGAAVIILGTTLTGATKVEFNGTPATFTVVSSSEIETTVPAGATTGKVSVVTASGTLYSNTNFVVPQSALATSTALSSTPNPSNLGQSVTFTAKVTVTPPGTGTPTGTVTFLNGTTTLGSAALSSGEAVYATSGLSAGSHSMTAKYGGSTSFLGSTSPVLTQQVNTVTLSPTALNFGTQPVKTTTAAQTVTLTNDLATALTISGISFTGTDPGDFAQSNTCGSSVAAKGKCTISVKFTPQATGTRTATLNVKDSANNSPQTVSLTGTGELQVAWTPTSLTFAAQAVKTSSAAQTVTLTNDLATALTISGITFTGTDPSDFAQTNTCGSSVAAKGKCTISVKFTPQATGTRTATLNVKDSANNSPQTVSLTGTGELQVAWTPTSLTFAAQAVKTSSAAQTVTLTNDLSTALTISGISFTGTDPSDFAQTNTCGSSVAAKGKCTLSVKFTPQATGTRTATLNVKDTANNSPQTVKLTGTGE
jgi:uncharacterized repeat protein (TIGR03803 family)